MSDWNAPKRQVNRGEPGIRGRVLSAMALDVKPARHSGRRMALVIGNGAYKNPKVRALQNPQHDASDVADALQKLDFKVTRSLDATFDTLDKTTDEFSSSLQEWDDALFFYAGHGMQIEAENYLIPVEFDPSHEQDRAKLECFRPRKCKNE